MMRNRLEEFIGKTVRVKLFDDRIIEGELHKTGEERFKADPNLYLPHNYYVLLNSQGTTCIFRSSHVKKCEVTV